jgi:hypothetical protein
MIRSNRPHTVPGPSRRWLTPLLTLLTLAASPVHAVTMASNLGETTDALPGVTPTSWRATSFTTDSMAHTLNSVTLALRASSIDNSFLAPRIMADAAGVPAGAALEVFSFQEVWGPNNYTWASTGLPLTANTTYWMVLSGDSFSPMWDSTNSSNETGSWSIGDSMRTSIDSGGTWPTGEISTGKMSIDATAVPEPSSAALLSLGGLALMLRRRRK